jgi:hypothetical protein
MDFTHLPAVTNAFAGRGKKLAYDTITGHGSESLASRSALSKLGQNFLMTDHTIVAFTCKLYGDVSVNEVRSAQASQLPPTQDALEQHVLCANYQAAIWRRALIL